jgi:anaerobic magnesium-protoporphyrin IX monomethyl ester cyclase
VRVLFTSAPESGPVDEPTGAWLPLALVHLAGAARAAGHDCSIVDAHSSGIGVEELDRIIRERAPGVVCVSATTPGFPSALELCRRVRAPGRTTVVGGIHASFMYPEFLPAGGVDFAVVGEGEETLPELLHCLETGSDPARVAGIAFALGGRVIRTAPRPRMGSLDPLPKAWDLLEGGGYRWSGRPGSILGAITSSRGCPRRCSSCAEAALYDGAWRRRSVDSVAYELATLRREHGVEVVAFHDPAPAADGARFAELTARLAELDLGLELVVWSCVEDILRDEALLPGWRQGGVVHVGICRDPSEDRLAGDAKARALAHGCRAIRALRAAGISSETSFWIGFPDETQATIEETLARAIAWDPDEARFPLVTPLPYTPAWRAWGAHVVTRDYRRFNQAEPVVKPLGMELDEVAAGAERCSRAFERAGLARSQGDGARRAGPWVVHAVGGARAEPEAKPFPAGQDGRPLLRRPPRG